MNRSSLTPFVKWPGGKTRELDVIWSHLPKHVRTYYEPFLGGGAVYWAMPDEVERFKINDRAAQLTDLYLRVKNQGRDPEFITLLEALNRTWVELGALFEGRMSKTLIQIYAQARQGEPFETQVECLVNQSELSCVQAAWLTDEVVLRGLLDRRLTDKMKTMLRNERRRGVDLSDDDVAENLFTGLKDGFYMYMRWLFNHQDLISPAHRACVYYFIRMFCYSSMFRFNQSGEFNVPYGGMSYNRNHLTKKIAQMQSGPVQERLSKTEIFSGDFEELFEIDTLTRDDFIFLDPPYDSEFSTYELNTFGESEQRRLASFLIDTLSARGNPKWMMVIKSTPLIRELYEHETVRSYAFDKTYGVSFMDRNDRAVEHLMFTNYDH